VLGSWESKVVRRGTRDFYSLGLALMGSRVYWLRSRKCQFDGKAGNFRSFCSATALMSVRCKC